MPKFPQTCQKKTSKKMTPFSPKKNCISFPVGRIFLKHHFARIPQSCPKKLQKRDLNKNALRINSGVISSQFGRHYFQIKAYWAPFLLRFSPSFRRFSDIFTGFQRILPGFSPNQKFWGCGCTPFTPASYTRGDC